MKKATGPVPPRQAERPGPKQGERTGTVCPVCGDAVLKQELFGKKGALSGHRLVCSRRGCPWTGSVR